MSDDTQIAYVLPMSNALTVRTSFALAYPGKETGQACHGRVISESSSVVNFLCRPSHCVSTTVRCTCIQPHAKTVLTRSVASLISPLFFNAFAKNVTVEDDAVMHVC
jgi:hypothetical protein